MALIGERPEEVTDMRRSVQGEVYSSTFDEPVEDHAATAEVALERAKRIVESGEHAVLLARQPHQARSRIQPGVPQQRKDAVRRHGTPSPSIRRSTSSEERGTARKAEASQSSPPVSSTPAAGWTTSSMRSSRAPETWNSTWTANWADRRIYPAFNIELSGTRHEELLLPEPILRQVWLLRRMVSIISTDSSNPTEAAERILERMVKTQTNQEFLASITKPEKF